MEWGREFVVGPAWPGKNVPDEAHPLWQDGVPQDEGAIPVKLVIIDVNASTVLLCVFFGMLVVLGDCWRCIHQK